MSRSPRDIPAMAKNLRRKFVLVAMVSVTLVLTVLIGGVNIANYVNLCANADELIDLIAEYDGTFPTVVVGEEAAAALLADLAPWTYAGDDGTASTDDGTAATDAGTEAASGTDAEAGADGAADEAAASDDGGTAGADAAAEENATAASDAAAEEDGAGDEAGAAEDAGEQDAASAETETGSESESEAESGSGSETEAEAGPSAAELSEALAAAAIELFDETHGRISVETSYDTRYFTVVLDASGNAVSVDTSYIAAVSSDEAAALAQELAAAEQDEGFYGVYRYRAVDYEAISDDAASDDAAADGQTMYIFVDCTSELESFDTLLWTSIGISALGLVLVFLLVLVLSRSVIQPMVESYVKQKRFITDASHELKTPLSVIDAANEVVEIEYGESEWTQSIRDQVARLADLTNRLVFLSRMDEGENGFNMEDLSLSSVVEEAAAPYGAVAASHGKELTCRIEPDVACRGDGKALTQVVELLLDNAVRYSSEGSAIELSLARRGRHAVLTVENAVDEVPEGDLDRLFERFYRADTARSTSTGGSGVGLSVARAIVEAHKGTISASAPREHAIVFTVEL